jgi:predicted nucleic acid-binding protein
MIVSNATPLIAFSRIGRLDLLQKVVGNLVIPLAVEEEITGYAKNKPGVIELTEQRWITVKAVTSRREVQLLLPTLDRGEAEVITLGMEQNARLLLIDELTGRKVAQSLGLTVSGSVGVLVRARQLGEITAVRPFLEAMTQQGIRYSPRFIAHVLQSLGEQ